MSYVDGFVLVVPKRKLAIYKKMATRAGKVWREHGALDYRECVGDDLKVKMGRPFPKLARTRPGDGGLSNVCDAWPVARSRMAITWRGGESPTSSGLPSFPFLIRPVTRPVAICFATARNRPSGDTASQLRRSSRDSTRFRTSVSGMLSDVTASVSTGASAGFTFAYTGGAGKSVGNS